MPVPTAASRKRMSKTASVLNAREREAADLSKSKQMGMGSSNPAALTRAYADLHDAEKRKKEATASQDDAKRKKAETDEKVARAEIARILFLGKK